MIKIKNRNFILVCVLLVLGIVGCSAYAFYNYFNKTNSIGVKAVNLMYTYKTVDDLAVQDEELKKICTSDAYKYLTVTDADKALNTYIKLNRNPCTVEVIRSHQTVTGGYVLYTLKTNSISYGRLFEFVYDIKDEKINNPREMECIDFKRNDSYGSD